MKCTKPEWDLNHISSSHIYVVGMYANRNDPGSCFLDLCVDERCIRVFPECEEIEEEEEVEEGEITD